MEYHSLLQCVLFLLIVSFSFSFHYLPLVQTCHGAWDIQYLIVYISDTTKLSDPPSAYTAWTINGAGLKVSSEFGFGAIDAEAMVTRAKHWTNVPEQIHTSSSIKLDTLTSQNTDYKTYNFSFEVTEEDTSIIFLEHIAVTVNFTMGGMTEPTIVVPVGPMECRLPNITTDRMQIDSKTKGYSVQDFDPCDYSYQWTNRGDISITLTSPAGTESLLLPNRDCDICQDGLKNWTFMSVHFWGEDPVGNWTIAIDFDARNSEYLDISGVQKLDIYGVDEIPKSVRRIPSSCDPACVRGCAASGSQNCDSCKNYRDPGTLKCLDSCDKTAYNGYCLEYNPVSPNKADYHWVYIGVGVFVGGCIILVLLLVVVGVCIGVNQKRKRRKGYTPIEQSHD